MSNLSVTSQVSYRPTKPLPFELREHCIIYFEEELYTQAFSLLSNLLAAGTSNVPRTPAFVPPPSILSFTATLAVHPSLTNRTTSLDRHASADAALFFLRQVLATVGPVHADLGTAFSFAGQGASGRKRRHARRTEGGLEHEREGEDSEVGVPQVEMAKVGALWMRKESFWDVFGWAMNCAGVWPGRWERWKVWLRFMLDVLEKDWEARKLMEAETEEEAQDDGVLEESIIMKYLAETQDGGRSAKRRVLRAVFADGSKKALAEFGEVWSGETKDRRGEQVRPVKRRKLDLEQGDFGDWCDDEEEPSDEEDHPKTEDDFDARPARKASRPPREAAAAAAAEDEEGFMGLAGDNGIMEAYGGIETLVLRRRILALLARVADALPHHFARPEELIDLYTEFIRPLPLPVFSFFIMPRPPVQTHARQDHIHHFDPSFLTLLHRNLLRSILAAPSFPRDTVPLTPALLASAYLPFAANSTGVTDNARASLVLEALLRVVRAEKDLDVGEKAGAEALKKLREAAKMGIEARQKKVMHLTRRRGKQSSSGDGPNEKEKSERQWLKFSGARIMIVLDMFTM